ncbi:MAG: OmpH family outer membrane protein [Selenomonadaceae bacterium]|nr:OmpH family outer membrane protein [Selenomonadaceae bacterium]
MKCKNLKRSLAAVAASLCLAGIFAGCGTPKTQVGYIRAERVMKESAQITAIIEEGNAKLTDGQKKLMELEKKRAELGEEEYMKQGQAIQMELSGINQEYTEKVRSTLNGTLEEICKAKKLDVVVTNDNDAKLIMWGGVDITDEVIGKLQKK